MKGSEIHNLVVVKLEEYSPYNPTSDGPLLSGGDVLDEMKPIYSYISQHLNEAADEMLRIVPVGRCIPKSCDNLPIEDDNDMFIGKVALPYDYLRLHTFKMDGWKKPVHYANKAGDPTCSKQQYVRTRGNIYKPVVVEEIRKFGGIIMPSNNSTGTYLLQNKDKMTTLTGTASANNGTESSLGSVNISADKTGYGFMLRTQRALNLIVNIHKVYTNAPDEEPQSPSSDSYDISLVPGTPVILDNTLNTMFEIGANWSIDEVELTIQTTDSSDTATPVTVDVFDNAFITVNDSDISWLHYYSTLGEHTIDKYLYIPHFSNEQDYDDSVAELIALNCAKKVCEVFERTDSLKIISEEMKEVLQNIAL